MVHYFSMPTLPTQLAIETAVTVFERINGRSLYPGEQLPPVYYSIQLSEVENFTSNDMCMGPRKLASSHPYADEKTRFTHPHEFEL